MPISWDVSVMMKSCPGQLRTKCAKENSANTDKCFHGNLCLLQKHLVCMNITRDKSYPTFQHWYGQTNGTSAASWGGASGRPPLGQGTFLSFLQHCTVAAPALESWIGLGPNSLPLPYPITATNASTKESRWREAFPPRSLPAQQD